MALQTSGQISMTDIVGEFGGTAPHAVSEYYGEGGLPTSGQISWSDFYGESAVTNYSYGVIWGGVNGYEQTNAIDRINESGSKVGTSSTLGTARSLSAGGNAGAYAIYYGGNSSTTMHSHITRINNSGTLVGSETNASTSRYESSGAAAGSYFLVIHGNTSTDSATAPMSYQIRITDSGSVYSTDTSVSTAQKRKAGCSVENRAAGFFWGGLASSWDTHTVSNRLSRINGNGSLVGSESTYGSSGYNAGGAACGGTGQEGTTPTYCKCIPNNSGSSNNITRFNSSGTSLSNGTVGAVMKGTLGCRAGSTGLYYGGATGYTTSDNLDRIDGNGSQVGSSGAVSGTTSRGWQEGSQV